MIPIAAFVFTVSPTGMEVSFEDTSAGVPTSWKWDFGYEESVGVPKTSTDPNPTITFPGSGIYSVTLTATNAEGSGVFKMDILLNSEIPTLNLTIKEMVLCNLPVQLAVDTPCFNNSIQKWQLYLQTLLTPPIPDDQVFLEQYWPPIANVLISKLIVYDIILNAASIAMASYYAAIKNQSSQVSTSTIQVADYFVDLGVASFPTIINSISVNGILYGPSPALSTNQDILNWLNGLGFGLFYFEDTVLKSLGNANILTTFSITQNGVGSNLVFTQENVRVVPISQVIEGGGSNIGAIGPLKYIETGPSKTEWYDASTFWSSMFKSYNIGGSTTGGTGGIFENIVKDICIWSARLRIRMPMCPQVKSATMPMFMVARNVGCGCGNTISNIKLPPSKG